MINKIVDAVSALVVLAALAVAIFIATSRSRARDSLSATLDERRAFAEKLLSAHWEGPRSAPAVLLVYSSYACGWCHRLKATIDTLRGRYPYHFAVAWKHMIPDAGGPVLRVATAAECAAEQGYFHEYHDAAFANPRALNYRDGWRQIAETTGVPDLPALIQCVESLTLESVVWDHKAEARAQGFRATPSMLLNGMPIQGFLETAVLDELVAMEFQDRAALRTNRGMEYLSLADSMARGESTPTTQGERRVP